MTATNSFFMWFYYGMYGVGGWFILLFIALAAVLWLMYDSSSRHLSALGWRMGTIVTAALILPAIPYRFAVMDPMGVYTSALAPFAEPFFYLGVLGGILPPILAIGYYISHQGLAGCPQGHPDYDTILGQCPECRRLATPPPPPVSYPQQYPPPRTGGVAAPLPESKRKVQAWLVTPSGKSQQLCEHETTIGRSIQNDICFTNDTTISRQHAKIVEQGGRFRLIDLGSKTFTRVNDHVVREPVLLEPDDEIRFGENTQVRFVTSRR